MKHALIVIAFASILTCTLADLSQHRWCVKNTTTYLDVATIRTRTKMVSTTWYSPSQLKLETYQTIEKIPKFKEQRICCEGYQKEDSECVPICSGGCPKEAKCVKPETCECQEGYRMDGGICRLECENCENGECTDLGECECHPHYVRIENRCQAICRHKCLNGFCAAPDKCECNPGYEMSAVAEESGRCEPVCEGACGGNAYCSEPGSCACKYGFFGNATDVCQPWCKAECKNGDCIGPNNCACHQGFVKVDGLCIPDCQLGCQFGDCLDEGICRCWPGFLYNNATGSCQESLDNEQVVKSTTTTTHQPRLLMLELPATSSKPNDFSVQVTTVTTVTTIGVNTTKTAMTSTPHYQSCGNGSCICKEGFIQADASCIQSCDNCSIGDCVPIEVCLNQTSTESSSSTSESSTEISTTTPMTSTIDEVRSNCENGCWAGTCVDGVCQCPEGLILNDENDCIMPCEAKCKNGVCNQENICECQEGYVHKNGTECVPQCEKECVNGFCIAPNHCECLEGYMVNFNTMSGHICLPTCDGLDGEEGCVNGTCVAINKCRCFDGFEHKPGSRFECIPATLQSERKRSSGFWYLYILLGLLILLVAGILGLFILRKMYQDSYNVAKVEKCSGTVRYKNDEQPYCYI